jgi:hypothetical protein
MNDRSILAWLGRSLQHRGKLDPADLGPKIDAVSISPIPPGVVVTTSRASNGDKR